MLSMAFARKLFVTASGHTKHLMRLAQHGLGETDACELDMPREHAKYTPPRLYPIGLHASTNIYAYTM